MVKYIKYSMVTKRYEALPKNLNEPLKKVSMLNCCPFKGSLFLDRINDLYRVHKHIFPYFHPLRISTIMPSFNYNTPHSQWDIQTPAQKPQAFPSLLKTRFNMRNKNGLLRTKGKMLTDIRYWAALFPHLCS